MMNLLINPGLKKQIEKEDLVYVSDKSPGFFRQKSNKNFKYYDLEGKVIRDPRTLKRIADLAIPPAWKNVWVCPKKNGHLQVTGIDDRNRKQYLYHPDWIKICQQNKFSKMVDFGLSLPKIRNKINYDLQIKDLDKRRVLATVIWLLEHTFIRVGNEEYSRENNSFGLTTLRNKHVKVSGSEVIFNFIGKSGVKTVLEINNKKIARTIKRCIELPGYELFRFTDEDGERHVVDSEDVNLFLKEITGDDFSAKDFRTWGATTISADNFYHLGEGKDKKQIDKNIISTVKQVAKHLNNTVGVCKEYYIHPAVIETYKQKVLVPHFDYYAKSKSTKPGLYWSEYALIKLLQKSA